MKAITQVVGRTCFGTWKSLSGGRTAGSRVAALLLAVASLGVWSDSHAVPAFARQTNMPCQACHFQSFPAINSFGRAFKAGGYTMMMQQTSLTGDDLSLPPVLNASLITKIRYQKTNGDDKAEPTNTGELQFPDESALLIGGRAGENVGFLLEFATFGQADTTTGDFSLFASYKMPMVTQVDTVTLGFVPYSTDANGPGYGFELLNTGILRPQRLGEDRTALFGMQYLGIGTGPAEGFAFYGSGQLGFVNVSLWAPAHGKVAVKKLAPYVRAAITPRLGDWDAAFGITSFTGSAKAVDGAGLDVEYVTKATIVDAQFQGSVGSMPLGVWFDFAKAPGDEDPNGYFNTTAFDKTAWSVHGNLGVIPNKVTLLLGYRSADLGTDTANKDNALTIGGSYQIAQNMHLQLNVAKSSGSWFDTMPATGDKRTTLLLFTAF